MAIAPFHPPADASTYRELLLFEERLKTNAARLKRTKTRYQGFLAFLICIIVLLASEVALDVDLILGESLLRTSRWSWVPVFPYAEVTLLFIAVTTLVLFVATGTHSEKIAYANKYVVHANRSLRPFNMYFNTRAPPLLSTIPTGAISPPPSSPPPPPANRSRQRSKSLSPSPSAIPLNPIPPSNNPRGELIFSSRVSGAFRDGYERYRAAFERRREEKERAMKPWWKPPYWYSALADKERERETISPSPGPSRRNSPVPGQAHGQEPLLVPPTVNTRGSMRKRRGGSRAGTPGSSLREGHTREYLAAPSFDGTPPGSFQF